MAMPFPHSGLLRPLVLPRKKPPALCLWCLHRIIAVSWIETEGCMEQHRASPTGKNILNRSPQLLGTTAEQVAHGVTIPMISLKLAAVLALLSIVEYAYCNACSCAAGLGGLRTALLCNFMSSGAAHTSRRRTPRACAHSVLVAFMWPAL
jgi:hypothetical protein